MAEFDTGLVWFRRDLRTVDHMALYHALTRCRRVYCAFVFETAILAPLPASDRRVAFIHASLLELDAILRAAGGALWVRHAQAIDAIPDLARTLGIEAVFTHHDYEPFALARDAEVERRLAAMQIAFLSFKDQVVFEKSELLTGAGRPYTVFTPYKRAWLAALTPAALAHHPSEAHLNRLARPPAEFDAGIPSLTELGFGPALPPPLPAGASGAQRLLDDFKPRLSRYAEQRDFPALKGPSYLSVHLRHGTLSIRALARLAFDGQRQGERGAETWLNELIWRDFYFAVLHHFPQVADPAGHRALKPEYDRIEWEHGSAADAHFAAWCEGRTGYPLVDAAMRQLNTSGYMHNRLRMVAASFLIKDLGIDWRRGEAYFAAQLNDFDLAANNGGWQWAASSGCDAQPYFRIFNPVTQSEKFDPDGSFIRRYVPELAALPNAALHAPWLAKAEVLRHAGIALGVDYPLPLVDHASARQRTLARYAVVGKPRTTDPEH
jgi:deoxyribodipyrimidine photo-lyase